MDHDAVYFGFSPLRYWGGLYHYREGDIYAHCVLVPFDIGVVYIKNLKKEVINMVLVPFDIGVVYIYMVERNKHIDTF